MPGISIHVVDVASGCVARNLAVQVFRISEAGDQELITEGSAAVNGVVDAPGLDQTMSRGPYEIRLGIGDYYRSLGQADAPADFLDDVRFRFFLSDPAAHYHLPFKFTRWGFSCFRGA